MTSYIKVAQTESKSCDKFNSFRIVTIKNEFRESRIKLSIFALKTEILLEFRRLECKVFHSIIADGKKIIFESYAL